MIKYFSRNIRGSDYVVGDIHGCFSLLKTSLDKLSFDESTDRLFSVGDLVDRGTESEDVLWWLEQPWFNSVLGNHEDSIIEHHTSLKQYMMLEKNGGKWFLDLPKELKDTYVEAFSKLPLAIEVETDSGSVGIVHAACPVNYWGNFTSVIKSKGLIRQAILYSMWDRTQLYNNTMKIAGVHKVFHGHTPLKKSIVLGNRHYIDTGAVYTGNLTIVKL